jgi:hypothetical protein
MSKYGGERRTMECLSAGAMNSQDAEYSNNVGRLTTVRCSIDRLHPLYGSNIAFVLGTNVPSYLDYPSSPDLSV